MPLGVFHVTCIPYLIILTLLYCIPMFCYGFLFLIYFLSQFIFSYLAIWLQLTSVYDKFCVHYCTVIWASLNQPRLGQRRTTATHVFTDGNET